MENNNAPIVKEVIINAPTTRVWKALTDRDEMEKWYFNIKEFKTEVGFEFSFIAQNKECVDCLHLCKITNVDTNKLLQHTWRYDGYPGDSLVTYELFDEDGKTRLKLTHEGIESFMGDIHPMLAKDNFNEGWEQIIKTAIKDYVDQQMQ